MFSHLSHTVDDSLNPLVQRSLRDVRSCAPSHTGDRLESQQIQPCSASFLPSIPEVGVGRGWGTTRTGEVSLGKERDVGSCRLCSGMWGPVGKQPQRSPQKLLSGLTWGELSRALCPPEKTPPGGFSFRPTPAVLNSRGIQVPPGPADSDILHGSPVVSAGQ